MGAFMGAYLLKFVSGFSIASEKREIYQIIVNEILKLRWKRLWDFVKRRANFERQGFIFVEKEGALCYHNREKALRNEPRDEMSHDREESQ